MPIQLKTIGRQQSLTAVAKSAFGLSTPSAATVRAAEEALVRANPFLAEEGAIKAGVQIVVPPIKTAGADEGTRPVATGRETVVSLGLDRAKELSAATAAVVENLPKIAVESRALLADKAVRKAFVDAYPELSDAYAAAPKMLDEAAKQAAADVGETQAALASLLRDLPNALAAAGLAGAADSAIG